jgi:hypothetical protein
VGTIMGFGFLVMLAGACASSVVWVKAKIWFDRRHIINQSTK